MSLSGDLGRPLYSFGPFRLDPAQRLLFAGTRSIPLQPKAFETLLVLVRNSERVVMKDELLSAVWPDTFVEESNLTQNIFVLRKALKEGDPNRRYIVTIPGRGYQFNHPLSTAAPTNGHDSANSTERTASDGSFAVTNGHSHVHVAESVSGAIAHPARPEVDGLAARARRKSARTLFYLAAFFAIGIVGLVAGVLLFRHFSRSPRVIRVEQLTNVGRVDPWGRVASDGSRLFFIARDGDHWNTMQVAAVGGDAQPLAPDLRNLRIFDVSNRAPEMLVAPFVARSGNLPLYTMPLVGGPLRRVGNIYADDAALSPDGAVIAYSFAGSIYLSDFSGTTPRLLVSCGGDCYSLAWSPEGKRISFSQRNADTGKRTLEVVSAAGGPPRSVVAGWDDSISTCCGRWTADGKYLAFAAETRRESQIWVMRESAGFAPFRRSEPVRVSVEARYHEPLPSRDGRTIYVQAGASRSTIESVNVANHTLSALLHGAQAFEMSFSRDGRYALYTTEQAVWRVNADGSSPLRLFANSDALAVRHAEWSPDGNHVIFQAERANSAPTHYLADATGGELREIPELGHPFKIADFSPDGRRLVYGADSATLDQHPDKAVLRIYDLDSGKSEMVPGSGGSSGAKWSPDGRFLSVYANDLKTMRLYEFATRKWTNAASGNFFTSSFWTPDSKYFYFQDLLDSGEPVFRVRVSDGKKERVYSFEDVLHSGPQRCGLYGFAPNGDLVVRVTRDGGDLYALTVDLP